MARSSFAPAFFLLPPRKRRALTALHRFCRAADDAVDGAGPPRVEAMRHELAALYGETAPRLAETRDLAPFVAEFGLERRHFDDLLAALARDARGEPIRDEPDLVGYCEGVAAAPGHLALAIFGAHEAAAYARALGVALQCTNILRDVRADWASGRSYLPASDLAALGLELAQLRDLARSAVEPPRAVHDLLERQRARIARWFAEGETAYGATPLGTRQRLVAARAMERIYRELARLLVHRDPWRGVPRVGMPSVARALATSWWEAKRHAAG